MEDASGVELYHAALDLRGAKDRQIQDLLLKENVIFRLAFKYPKSTIHYCQLEAAFFAASLSITFAIFSIIGVYSIASEEFSYTFDTLIILILFFSMFATFFVLLYIPAFRNNIKMAQKENEWEIIHITKNYLIISKTNNRDLGIQNVYDKKIEKTRYALAIQVKNIIKLEPRRMNSSLRKWLERPEIQFLKIRRWGEVMNYRFTDSFTVPVESLSRILMVLKKINPGIVIDERIKTGLNL